MSEAKASPAAVSDELARFREAWRAEVQHRKQLQQSGQSSALANPEQEPRLLEGVLAPTLGGGIPLGSAPTAATVNTESANPWAERVSFLAKSKTNFTPAQVSAIDIYSKAVIAEENGNLDTALHLYRTAFRKYDAVDKLWRTAETQAMTREDGNVNYTKYEAKPVIEPSAIRNMTQQMASLSASKPAAVKDLVHSSLLGQAAHTASVTGSLEATVEGFPPILGFELEELAQQRTFTINSFPDEILVKILINLSPQLVERFALASRKARIMTLDSTLWRTIAQGIYKPPQIPTDESIESIMVRFKSIDYRRLYIEQPRVRLDGVYIAVCHYVRNGLSDNPWVNMSHLVTYHRYLRFYPNGQVLSMLANEHDNPQHLIGHFNLSLRMKGLSIGTWNVVLPPADAGDDKRGEALVYIDNLTSREPDAMKTREARYHFQMTLSLRSRPLGRWNKLEFVRYASVALETGETEPLPLKHERAFWFSKVRSYGSGQNMEKELQKEAQTPWHR